jgi:hypothetical protein
MAAAGRVVRLACLAGLAVSLVHCGTTPVPPLASPRAAAPAPPASGGDSTGKLSWRFSVAAGAGARELSAEAQLSPGSPDELSVDTGAEPFVRGVEVEQGGAWVGVSSTQGATGTSGQVRGCRARGCRVRYRFLLAEAAAELDDLDQALAQGDTLLAPPSTWLLHPVGSTEGGEIRLSVTTPPGITFVTGLARAPAVPAQGGLDPGYVAGIFDLPEAPYAAFGRLRVHRFNQPGGSLDVAIAPGALGLADAPILRWVSGAASGVSAYYGQFPMERALLVLLPLEGRGVLNGRTLGNGGASIVVSLGAELRESDLARDWILVHELLHLAFPSLPRRNLWLEEGLSTYVEPLIRLEAGLIDEQTVWRDLVRSLPNGLPARGDRGLDNTPTWGRTYWGGALFCFLADIEIRKQSGNRRSLADALRAIVRAGGNAGRRWSLEQSLAVGDGATGLSVLRDLHARMGPAPLDVDLAGLWRELGVRLEGDRVVFDDGAPLASIRRAISAPPGAAAGGRAAGFLGHEALGGRPGVESSCHSGPEPQ